VLHKRTALSVCFHHISVIENSGESWEIEYTIYDVELIVERGYLLEIVKLLRRSVNLQYQTVVIFVQNLTVISNCLFPLRIEVERSILEETIGGLLPRANEAKRCAYRATDLGAGAESAAIRMLSTLCAFVLVYEKAAAMGSCS
jgi:hypothetical protein